MSFQNQLLKLSFCTKILHFYLFALMCLVAFYPALAQAEEGKKTICLNMIVKNEQAVITRCLRSLLPIIDYFVIVDTGSSDGTQQVIKEFMAENQIKGELYERPWVDFAYNRNQAMELAKGKGDYLLFIDADDYLEYDESFRFPLLDKDYYYVSVLQSGTKYSKVHLIDSKKKWEWVGVLHEVLVPPVGSSFATLEGLHYIYTSEGARSKNPKKYLDDAKVLEAAVEKEPDNRRYLFYLAQSYLDAREYPQALHYYQKRASMGGWDEEVYWSMLQAATIQQLLDAPHEEVIKSYVGAYMFRPSRFEALYHLARLSRMREEYEKGYQLAKLALSIPPSDDLLFVQQWMQDYGIRLELSISAWWIGEYEECQKLSLELLEQEALPEDVRACVKRNLEFANTKLLEKITSS